MPNKPTSEQLYADNQDLRARLEKTEATLSEILSGEADALFVTGVGGAQLFTLKGADQSYRTLIENMSEGALTLTPEGLVLYANRRFAGMLKTPLEKVIGSEIYQWFAPESRQIIQALLQKEAIDNYHEELNLAAADGPQVPVYLSVSRLVLNEAPGSVCMVATDLTEQKRNEAILAAEKLSNAILEQAADAIVICDETGRIMRASKQAQALYGNNLIGQLFDRAFPLRQLDGTAFSAVGAIDTIRSPSVEARMERNGQGLDLMVSAGHLFDSQNKLLGSVVTLTDITERKRVADKILESENLLRLVVENVPARIFWKDHDLRYLGCNTRFAKDAGRSSPDELTGKTDFEMGWKEQAELYRADDMKVLDLGVPKLDIEEPQTTPDGNTIWLRTSKVPLRNKDNQIIGILGLYQDITESRQAGEHLKLFRTLLDNSSDAIEVLDPATLRILDVNETQCRALGYSREEMLSMKIADFDPALNADLLKVIEEQIRKTGAARFESMHRRKDGSTFPVEVSAKLIELDKPYALNMVRDITERKHAEAMLHESEERFRAIFDGALDGIGLADLETRQFVAGNAALCHMLGYSKDEFVRLRIPDIHRQQDWPYVSEQFDKQARGEIKLATDLQVMRKDGSVFYADINTSFLDLGSKHYILGVFRDITDRNQAELELRESQRRFSDLLGNVELASMMLDREARITYCNNYLLRLTGWQREEVIGKNWFDLFVPPEILDLRNEFFTSLLDNRPEARYHENEILTRSGQRRMIRWSNSVLRSEIGKVIGTASIGEDITDRNRLELEKELYLKFFMLSTNAMCIADPDGCFKRVNPAFVNMTGYSEYELLSKPFLHFVLPEDRKRTMDEMKLQVEVRPTLHFENRYVCHDGTVVRLSWTAYYDRLDGTTYATADDITVRRKAEARIVFLNRVYAVLSGIDTLIVRVRDRDELFREACRIAVEAGGLKMAMLAIVDRSTMKIVPVASAGKDEELMTAIKALLSSNENASKTMVAKAIREKQTIVSNDTQCDPRLLLAKHYAESGVRSMVILPLIVADEVVGALVLYAGDINFFLEEELKLLTELAGDIAYAIDHIDKQERLDYLAYYDVLTGLANRSLFLDRVAQYMHSAVSGGFKLAIGLIDLERFKNINDSLGRPAGDALLKQVAEWLTHNLGGASLLARVDADHFAVVVPEVKQAGDLSKLLDKTSQAFLDHPFQLNDNTFRIAAKGGIAIFPDDGVDVDTLFKNAEAALKKAKASGARYLFYTQKMTEAVAGNLTLENQLRHAIDNEEFVLHYQPKVNLASGKVTSAEALIRWNDPRTGLVPPVRFIPILEETGLIHEVGRWALHQAIADNLRWRNAGLDVVRIAVNVSALQMRDPGFIGEIERAIAIDVRAAEGVELEITESLIMEDIEHNIATLQAIRAMGITIAIDDFGTGFSSLNYLAKLPMDTLKIDRSFVINMTAPEGLSLVSTIIIVAHALKLNVVAEGVETEEQSSQLRSLNCDEMQGYLFSKPVPAEIFETRFLAPHSPEG
jgi:diguanylate cyclase (GGDEF)-like protein/PAS domain S-box-containing protein